MLCFYYINSWTQWMWQILYLRNVFYLKELLKKFCFITQKFSIVSYAYLDIVYIFIKYWNSSFTLIYWNYYEMKRVTYFKDFKKCFIRIQCFSMLLFIKEILLCNFLCKFKYNSCIALIFKLKTYIYNFLRQSILGIIIIVKRRFDYWKNKKLYLISYLKLHHKICVQNKI